MAISFDNFQKPSALARFVLVCIIGLAADLWTKNYAFKHLAPANASVFDNRPQKVKFIPDWVHFEITTNRGAVFGIGQGQKGLFLAVSVVAILFLSYLFSASGKQRFYQVILGMLLAGVLGNMYDRIVHDHVRDMIHALPDWKWPGTWTILLINYPAPPGRNVFPFIFNVADILLCVGVGLMVVYSLFHKEPATAKEHEAQPNQS